MNINKIFKNGYTELSRIELEDLPCPFDITLISDKDMRIVVNNTEAIYQERTRNAEISDDRKSEIWWNEMEDAVRYQGIKYLEDYDEFEYQQYEQRRKLIEEQQS